MAKEFLVSVDIEANGPIPGPHSMMSLGAVAKTADGRLLGTWTRNFLPLENSYDDPDTAAWWQTQPEAYAEAMTDRRDPALAMTEFNGWVMELAKENGVPVFVAYPVVFDWGFVNFYFHRFLGHNPFGFKAFDMLTMAATLLDCAITEVSKSELEKQFPVNKQGLRQHVALDDALEQDQLFFKLRAYQADQKLARTL